MASCVTLIRCLRMSLGLWMSTWLVQTGENDHMPV